MSDTASSLSASSSESSLGRVRNVTSHRRARDKTLSQRLNPWIRTLHLYCGVALAPFVLLYGVSAFLMNHSGIYKDTTVESLDSVKLQQAALGPIDAQQVAGAAVAAMNRLAAGRHRFQLVDGESLHDAPLSLKLDSRGADMRQRYTLDLAQGEGKRQEARGASSDNKSHHEAVMPLAGQVLTLASPLAVPLVKQQASLREAIGANARQPLSGGGTLAFTVEDGAGKRFNAQLDLYSGKLKGLPVGQSQPSAGLAESLTRLHKQHSFSGGTLELLWAVVVDIMATVMVMWGLTGLWMWWQMKRRRPLGGVLLVAGVGLSTALGLGIHSTM